MNSKKSIVLVKPDITHCEFVMEYKSAFLKTGEEINGSGVLSNSESYEQWLDSIMMNEKTETVKPGLVPANTYLAINELDEIVGMINIRHILNEHLLIEGGHIGYSVHPNHRQKGYATEILKLGLAKCKNLNIDKVLVTCTTENIGSRKAILNNGGVLENSVDVENETYERYWIKLED
ncbi:MAG: GNAT family N-acetyltransferase [Tissierellia bacterium]|nr:GNAT family N-acetyltransferase [Tissierellia bacterium]